MLARVIGQEAGDPTAVLLKRSLLATITPVGVRAAQMLAAIQFDWDFRSRADQVHFHAPPAIKENGRSVIQGKGF